MCICRPYVLDCRLQHAACMQAPTQKLTGSGITAMTCRYMQFYGFHGILAGIIVAVKQVMPEHEAKLFGVVRLSFKVSPCRMH